MQCRARRRVLFVLYRLNVENIYNKFAIKLVLHRTMIVLQSNPCAHRTTTTTTSHDTQLIHVQKNVIKKSEMNFVAFINPSMCFFFLSKRQLFSVHTTPFVNDLIFSLASSSQKHLPKITLKQRDRQKEAQRGTWINRQIDNSSEKHFTFHFMQYLREIKSRNMYKCFTHAAHSVIRRRLGICMHYKEMEKKYSLSLFHLVVHSLS